MNEVQNGFTHSRVRIVPHIHTLDMIGGIYFNDDQSLDNISTSSLLAQCFTLTVTQPPISSHLLEWWLLFFKIFVFLYKSNKLIMYNKCLFRHIIHVFFIVLAFVFRLLAHSGSHWLRDWFPKFANGLNIRLSLNECCELIRLINHCAAFETGSILDFT